MNGSRRPDHSNSNALLSNRRDIDGSMTFRRVNIRRTDPLFSLPEVNMKILKSFAALLGLSTAPACDTSTQQPPVVEHAIIVNFNYGSTNL